MSNWQEMALAHGWIEANENGEPCLAHEELDRIWPLGNCGFYGCETPRETCPLIRTASPTK